MIPACCGVCGELGKGAEAGSGGFGDSMVLLQERYVDWNGLERVLRYISAHPKCSTSRMALEAYSKSALQT